MPLRPDAATPHGGTTVCEQIGKLPLDVFVPLLVEKLGMLRADAALACGHGAGIFLDNISPAAAEAIAAALREHNQGCRVVPAADVIPLPHREPVRAARLSKAEISFVDLRGEALEEPWDDGIALVMGHVDVRATTTRHLASARHRGCVGLGYGGVSLGAVGTDWTVDTTAVEWLVDVAFADPLRCYRIQAGDFDYGVLKDQEQAGSEPNFTTLVRWLIYAMPHVRTNLDAQQFVQAGHAPVPHYAAHAFDQTLHWLINIAPRRSCSGWSQPDGSRCHACIPRSALGPKAAGRAAHVL